MTNSLAVGEEGFIIILDVLGTKGYWLRTDPETGIENFSKMVDMLDLWKSKLEKKLESKRINLKMSTYHFSDTILITLVPNAESKLSDIVSSSLLISSVIIYGLDHGILLRGSISFGKFYRKREDKYSFILGPAVDEAAEWYDKGQIIGAYCSPNLSFGLDAYNENKKLGIEYFTKFPVPLKDNRIFKTWVLNWPIMISFYFGKADELQSSIDYKNAVIINKKWVLEKFSNLSIGINEFNKFENTVKFYDHVIGELSKQT